MKVQLGSIGLPILVMPRISGQIVTVSQIKTQYSNFYVSDSTTPMNFYLEYRDRLGNPVAIAWNSSSSTNTTLYFPIPNSFYSTLDKYSIMIYWTVTNLSSVILEQIYTQTPLVLEVVQEHDNI